MKKTWQMMILFYFYFTTWKLEIERKSGSGFFVCVFSVYRLLLLLLGSLPGLRNAGLPLPSLVFVHPPFLPPNYMSALPFF